MRVCVCVCVCVCVLCVFHPVKHCVYSRKFDVKPPAVVKFSLKAALPSVTPLQRQHVIPQIRKNLSLRTLYARLCPESHFQCWDNGHCLPVFVLCNGVYDCPGREDERECDQYTCPGYYRCRGVKTCLHPDHVCDGLPHCPQQDDERYCEVDCPSLCFCQGQAFTCRHPFPAEKYPHVRYLDVSRSGLAPKHLYSNPLLVYLNLQRCSLTSFVSYKLPNLRILDIR